MSGTTPVKTTRIENAGTAIFVTALCALDPVDPVSGTPRVAGGGNPYWLASKKPAICSCASIELVMISIRL